MDAKKFGSVAFTAFLKTILLAFNLIFFAFGLAFFIIGIYGFKVFNSFFTFASSTTIYIPFICIGLFMMIVGALSLYCTPKGVTWLLYLYGIIVFLLFVAILSLSALFMVKRDALESSLKTGIVNSINNYPKDADSIDLMQSTIRCCGSENYTDWFSSSWAKNEKSVPKSCCINKQQCVHENINTKNVTDIYTEGCYKKVENTIESNYSLIGGIGFASAIIIFGGSLLSCSLARNINRNKYEQME